MICVTQYLLRKQISGICADNTALTSKYNIVALISKLPKSSFCLNQLSAKRSRENTFLTFLKT